MENEIKNAEYFLDGRYIKGKMSFEDNVEAMKEFARFHVKAALEAASKKAKLNQNTNNWQERYIDKDSITGAYPEDLIK